MSYEPELPKMGDHLVFGLGQVFMVDVPTAFWIWMLSFLQHWVVYGLWGPVLAALLFCMMWQVDEPSKWKRVCGPLLVSGLHLAAVAILRRLIETHPWP